MHAQLSKALRRGRGVVKSWLFQDLPVLEEVVGKRLGRLCSDCFGDPMGILFRQRNFPGLQARNSACRERQALRELSLRKVCLFPKIINISLVGGSVISLRLVSVIMPR